MILHTLSFKPHHKLKEGFMHHGCLEIKGCQQWQLLIAMYNTVLLRDAVLCTEDSFLKVLEENTMPTYLLDPSML